MKIKMRSQISGTRDGVPWPPPGSVVELPDVEAAKYCANGLATPVAEDPEEKVEKAVVDEPEERGPLTTKRGPGRPRKTVEAEK